MAATTAKELLNEPVAHCTRYDGALWEQLKDSAKALPSIRQRRDQLSAASFF